MLCSYVGDSGSKGGSVTARPDMYRSSSGSIMLMVIQPFSLANFVAPPAGNGICGSSSHVLVGTASCRSQEPQLSLDKTSKSSTNNAP